jgi:lipopolysaccharide export system protein LptA
MKRRPSDPLAEKNFRTSGRRLLVLVAAALAIGLDCASLSFAERSDSDKPVNLEADRVDLDDAKKEAVFVGNVTLTQGTLSIKADKIIVKQDAAGFQYGIAYGKPAHFRQKREGFDEYIEGFSERLEYDGKADKVQMFTNARIQRGGDEVRGDYISYNAVTEFFQVIGGGKSASSTGNSEGRVHATIQPKPKGGNPAPSGSVELKPSGSVQSPKQ